MWFWSILFCVAVFGLAYQRASLSVWTIALGMFLLLFSFFASVSVFALTFTWILFAGFAALNVLPLRRSLISRPIFSLYKKLMPALSETEKEALTSGTPGWPAHLLSGAPDWDQLHAMPISQLSDEEQRFLEGPVEQLCSMIDNWEINYSMQIPPHIWEFLKKEGFFGIIIPKEYGGKGFSAMAHSQILVKVSWVSVAVATVIAVPNSLGPGELLLHYGTESQKNHFLPRLARGEEIPCFALTSPVAGSDASAIIDTGILIKHQWEGKERICIRLNWQKRYITLSPIATLIGLAFKLYDPDHLLGDQVRLGITCALIPAHLPGVITGRRHFPLHCAFPNGPTEGHDVIIPADWIIGGTAMAGQGWRMLMENLAAGRSISLPSMVTGSAIKAALASGAYSAIRRQFNVPIGHLGGVEEALTRIAARTYLIEATRIFTISAVDQKQRPAVASAISKCHTTEISALIAKDAMEIHGGKGICMGPRNYLAQAYIEQPISITVEGANILTRSMIIFGQGLVRCHPYVFEEMTAAEIKDPKEALAKFDRAIFGHIGFFISNLVRSFILGITNARLVKTSSSLKYYYQQFTRFSSILALMADTCMLVYGGNLKRKEKISARLGDVLSDLYLGSALLKYFSHHPQVEEMPLVEWLGEDLLFHMQTQLDGILQNMPSRLLSWVIKAIIFPVGQHFKMPSDRLGKKVAQLISQPSSVRLRLAKNIYYTPAHNNPVANMEAVLHEVLGVVEIEKKISQAKRKHMINGKNYHEVIVDALNKNVITQEEAEKVFSAEKGRKEVIWVDDFAKDWKLQEKDWKQYEENMA